MIDSPERGSGAESSTVTLTSIAAAEYDMCTRTKVKDGTKVCLLFVITVAEYLGRCDWGVGRENVDVH